MAKGGAHLKPSSGTGGKKHTSGSNRELTEKRRPASASEEAAPARQRSSTPTSRPAPSRSVAASPERRPAGERRPAPERRETREHRPAPEQTARPAPSRREEPAPRRSAAPAPRPAAPVREERPPRKPARKKRRSKGVPLWLIIGLLGVILVVSLIMLGKAVLGYAGNRSQYKSVQEMAIIPKTPEATAAAEETGEKTEVVRSEIPFDVDWDALRAANPDIIAWLYCPDTVINYPVVQCADNETYLDTNFSGKSNAGGALFADYNSIIGFRSSHLIIYGHNMKDNSMFGTLKNYLTREYYEEHPIFYLLTPDQCYRVELLDCQTIEAVTENYPTYFSGDGTNYESYIARMTASAYWVNEEADYESYQLLTMSTCTSADDERLILQGVLVPIE